MARVLANYHYDSLALDYSNTLSGEKETLSLKGTCTREGERLTGEVKYTAPDGREWTLQPNVTLTEKKLQGTVEISAKEKKKKLFSFVLEVLCIPAGERKAPVYENTVSLKDMDEETARAALFQEEMVLMRAVKYLMDGLSEKEQQIIILRYYKEKTQTEVARMLGISQVQVSRMEKKILLYMREKIVNDN